MNQEISARMCKRCGKRAVSSYGLRLPIFLSFIITVFSFLGMAYLFYELCLLLCGAKWASALSIGVSLLGAVFLLAPLWRGLNAYPLFVTSLGRRDIGLLFFFFSHKHRYFYAVRRALLGMLRLALFFGLLYAICALGRSVSADLLQIGRNSVALLVSLLSIFFTLLLIIAFDRWMKDLFLLDHIFLSSPLLTYRQAKRLSARRMRYGSGALWRLNLSFLPLWGISLLLFCVPLVIFVPYYITARARFSSLLMKI